MDFKELKQFCDNAWIKKHGFVVFNLWDTAYCGIIIHTYTFLQNINKIYYIILHDITTDQGRIRIQAFKLTLMDRSNPRKRVINPYSRSKLKNINRFFHLRKNFQRPCRM